MTRSEAERRVIEVMRATIRRLNAEKAWTIKDNLDAGYRELVAAILDALPADDGWRPIDWNELPRGQVLLYWPEVDKGGRNHHAPMMRVDYAGSTPYRRPTHWRSLPSPPDDGVRG